MFTDWSKDYGQKENDEYWFPVLTKDDNDKSYKELTGYHKDELCGFYCRSRNNGTTYLYDANGWMIDYDGDIDPRDLEPGEDTPQVDILELLAFLL